MILEEYILAQSTYSRRELLRLMTDKQITVNGKVVTDFTQEVNHHIHKIVVEGNEISGQVRYRHYLFNKPRDVLSTLTDPKGRKCLGDFMHMFPNGVKPVGRLDRETTGLMIFSNDGEFAHRLAHPSFKVNKTYRVSLDKALTKADYARLTSGLFLSDGPVKMEKVELESDSVVLVTLYEGRNRIVRRTFETMGYDVVKLKRLHIGNFSLGNLESGKYKIISQQQLATFHRSVENE
jgi:23S rRNA pseudouridine2605 synthase